MFKPPVLLQGAFFVILSSIRSSSYPILTGSKILASGILSIRKEIGGGSTARKDPTRSFLRALALRKVSQAQRDKMQGD